MRDEEGYVDDRDRELEGIENFVILDDEVTVDL